MLGYRQLQGQGMDADPARAFRQFAAAAGAGDGYALFNLGYLHLHGIFVDRDLAWARTLFQVGIRRVSGMGRVYFCRCMSLATLPHSWSWSRMVVLG